MFGRAMRTDQPIVTLTLRKRPPLASGLLAGPEGMCYCGPAVHALFIGSTRMAGDDDFIKSGKEGGAGLGLGGPAF